MRCWTTSYGGIIKTANEMKTEMRQKLAQLPFEEKIRKVGELIRLARNVKAQSVREDDESYSSSDSEFTRRGGPKRSKK
jgi:hypothetical protein